jgi:hypothetical protein
VTTLRAAAVLSGVAFVGFGVSCLVSRHMRREFARYGLTPLRSVVGTLEVLGGVGLLASAWGPPLMPLMPLAAGGLCLLMAGGVVVRVRVRDRPLLMVPAVAMLVVNGLIVRASWSALRP